MPATAFTIRVPVEAGKRPVNLSLGNATKALIGRHQRGIVRGTPNPQIGLTASLPANCPVKVREVMMHASGSTFGPFRLLPTQFLLLEGDKQVPLGSRALEILIALLERRGELVSKQDLMARVWPNAFVESANLTVHMSALRRALRDGQDGNRFIINIPGHGYCFI